MVVNGNRPKASNEMKEEKWNRWKIKSTGLNYFDARPLRCYAVLHSDKRINFIYFVAIAIIIYQNHTNYNSYFIGGKQTGEQNANPSMQRSVVIVSIAVSSSTIINLVCEWV